MATFTILYFSVHEVLEYDDLLMLTAQGHRVFSLGVYREPGGGVFRKPLDRFFQPDLARAFTQGGLTREFVAAFDIVVINHDISIVERHADVWADKPIVYRTIGQSNLAVEAEMARLANRIAIVRYSAREVRLAGFAGTDAVISFSKDAAAYPDWVGGATPITNHNNYAARSYASVPPIDDYAEMVVGTDAVLFGMGNQEVANWGGLIDFDDLVARYTRCACYVYVWTFPPSYTLSLIEAMLVGAPVIAPSLAFVTATRDRAPIANHPDADRVAAFDPGRYAVPDLLGHSPALLYDSLVEARHLIARAIARDPETLRAADAARSRARKEFDVKHIGSQWTALLESLATDTFR